MRRENRLSRRNLCVLIPVFFLCSLTDLAAQEPGAGPSWVLFEKGQKAYRQGDYGDALRWFQQAAEREAVYPEAEYWIGIIYEKEGQLDLAERQYLKALEMSRALYIPHDRYEILYRLAEIRKLKGDLRSYEETLLEILDAERALDPTWVRSEQSWSAALTGQGLDRLLYLYRLQLTWSARASSQLGIYYYKKKDYRAALLKNLMVVMTGYTVAIHVILSENPDFEFPGKEQDLTDLDEDYYYRSLETPERPYSGSLYVLDKIAGDDRVTGYLTSISFYESLYYLGLSLRALGYREEAQKIFDILRNTTIAGVWQKRGAAAYDDPDLMGAEIIF